MQITIHPTAAIVKISARDDRLGQHLIECRVWEGESDKGVKVACLIPRIAAGSGDLSDFERELQATPAPASMPDAFLLRMVL